MNERGIFCGVEGGEVFCEATKAFVSLPLATFCVRFDNKSSSMCGRSFVLSLEREKSDPLERWREGAVWFPAIACLDVCVSRWRLEGVVRDVS